VTSPGPSTAVFISYAREDAVAADRIAEALRSHGIEVWFDRNELRGGDTWDQKIRGQLRTCSLLIPIVSANTQTRGEGYFRREWKLAAERTHDMAAGIPFLVPVVIDDTAESGALVPEEFMRVQWTRLPQGRTTPQFAAQVKRLLEAPRGAAPTRREFPVGKSSTSFPTLTQSKAPNRVTPLVIGAIALTAIAAAMFLALRTAPSTPAAPAALSSRSAASPTEGVGSPAAIGTAPSEKSVAVLPFANFSTDKDNEAFAEGMHDDVITNLQKIRDLKVISRTSVLAFRDAASRNLAKIASELGVANVVEGSVRRVGNQVRVNAKLIDARTEAGLWVETLTGDASDIFALQARIAEQIAAALKATLTASERTLIARRPTQNQEAYEHYHRAVAQEETLSTRSLRARYDQVVALHEQAVARDPNFALAYARLAAVNATMYFIAVLDPNGERRARALAAVEAAERLAPDAPETLAARGTYSFYCENDFPRALAQLRAAETGLPNDAWVAARIGLVSRRLGRTDDTIKHLERAVALNPHHLYLSTQLVQAYFLARRYPQALAAARRGVALAPGDQWLREWVARTQYAIDGDRSVFLRERAALPPSDNDPGGLREAYLIPLLRGDYAAAEQALLHPQLHSVSNMDSALLDPVSLLRAQMAFLRGDAPAARRFAEETLTQYANSPLKSRQALFVSMNVARAKALAGRAEEAAREGKAALDAILGRDSPGEAVMRLDLAKLYVVINRPADALAVLREMMNGVTYLSAPEIRHDPFLARLKEHPRFEEILKSAKPL
jgi:TolB-like protein